MQQYFQTGKVIVIDDQYEEAQPLLTALSKNQIPFLYSQGKPNSEFPLPNTDPNLSRYYNLIFLDLNLDFQFAAGISNDDEEKTFKSTHAQILELIVKNRNRSFVLIIWSNEEENYKEHFLKIFDPSEKYSTSKRPYKIISLSKKDFFSTNADGKHEFIVGKENDLKERINQQLADLEAFKLFCEWDRVVSQSVSDTIDDFMSLINRFPFEDEREHHLAKIITAISIAYSGDEGYLKLHSNEEKTDSVLLALTQILNDDIDRNVLIERQAEFKQWEASNKEEIKTIKSSVNKSLLNRKLLVFKPNRKDLTGSSYKASRDKIFFQRAFLESFDILALSKDFIKQYKKDHAGLTSESIEKIQRKFCLSVLVKNTIPVELNITPLCDIVQNKLIVHRLIKGLLIPAECIDKMSRNEYFIKTPVFSIDDKDFFLGLDLRTLSSCTVEEIIGKDYLFTLRTNLINDIQTKLASHVSRLGVFNL